MCNVNRNNKVIVPVVVNHDLSPNSCHKKKVGQVHSHASLGQVRPVHNRFMVPQTDTQTQD